MISDLAVIVELYAGPPSKVPLPPHLTFAKSNFRKGIGKLVVSSDTRRRCYPAIRLYKHVGRTSVVEWIIYPYWDAYMTEDTETDSDDDEKEDRRLVETTCIEASKDMYPYRDLIVHQDETNDVMEHVPYNLTDMFECHVLVRSTRQPAFMAWNDNPHWTRELSSLDRDENPLAVFHTVTEYSHSFPDRTTKIKYV